MMPLTIYISDDAAYGIYIADDAAQENFYCG